MALAQQSGDSTSVCHRSNGRSREIESRPPFTQAIQATYQSPSKPVVRCSQKSEFSSAIFCNMVSYYRLHRWQLLLTHLIIRATAP